MTGSSLAPIIIPIVVMASLAAWLILVFHAANHPQWSKSPAREQPGSQPAALAGRRQPQPGSVPHHRAA